MCARSAGTLQLWTCLWGCNSNADVDCLPKRIAIRVIGLPGAFVDSIGKGSAEKDLNCSLRPGAGRVKHGFLGCAECGTPKMAQAVRRVPVAGARILHE